MLSEELAYCVSIILFIIIIGKVCFTITMNVELIK